MPRLMDSARTCARAIASAWARSAGASSRPPHTAGHISYVFGLSKLVFVGDTLFQSMRTGDQHA
jgi:hypothetical protein